MAWISAAFRSEALHMPVEMEILAPQGHFTEGLSVMMLLHGPMGDRTEWLLKSRIARYVEGLPVLVCMPSGKNSYFSNTANGYQYGDFVTKELPGLLKRLFFVSEKKEDWLIGGIAASAEEGSESWLCLAGNNYGNGAVFGAEFLHMEEGDVPARLLTIPETEEKRGFDCWDEKLPQVIRWFLEREKEEKQ